jgi:hypothetical protein
MREAISIIVAALLSWGQPLGPVPAISFRDVKLVVQAGEKTTLVDVILVFEEGRLVLRERAGEKELRQLDYANLAAEYAYSKHYRWGTAIGLAAASTAGPAVVMAKSKKHWFSVRTPNDSITLQLDKGNFRAIVSAFESRTGVAVSRLPDIAAPHRESHRVRNLVLLGLVSAGIVFVILLARGLEGV